MLCRHCGTSVKCWRCDVALTFHKDLGRLVCHYCGYRRIPPTSCSRCLGYRLSFYGFGTQSVAAEVSSLLPGASILRWDRDAQKSARSYGQLLDRFREGEAQVLVGTQMIAKGLHFPSVTLVGAVSADMGLNIPDYQAGERVFQAAVPGRRPGRKGRLARQGDSPELPAGQLRCQGRGRPGLRGVLSGGDRSPPRAGEPAFQQADPAGLCPHQRGAVRTGGIQAGEDAQGPAR